MEDSGSIRLHTEESRRWRDHDNEHYISNLIDKIERYNESEKVMSHQALFEECSKVLVA